MTINRNNKDRVFKFLFGTNKLWTLNLYNAINGINHDNPEEIIFNTMEDVLYLGMKNDVSFIILDEMNLWEHQSTFNPNMPMRFFLYAARLYDKHMANSDYYLFSSTLQPLPQPRCVCFYNGTEAQPEKKELKLSDAFIGSGNASNGDIEVKVTMLNVNYGKNKALMEACEPLKEYAWLVENIRRNQKTMKDLEAAVDAVIS